MIKTKKVFILGVNGFPFGSARIEKLKLIGKSLTKNKAEVVFIGHSWGYFKKGDIPCSGNFEGTNYIYTCGITSRPERFLQRRWVNLKGRIGEIGYLVNNRCDVAIVSVQSGMFIPLLYYRILSKVLNFKLYYPHHEDESATLDKSNLYNRINLFLFKKFAWKILDGVFPITSYLAGNIHKQNPDLPFLVIPSMVDFDYFDNIRKVTGTSDERYFMYCGSIVYFEIIDFIITAFEGVDNSEYNLHLVSFGNLEKENKLKKRIEASPKKRQIFTFGYLDYNLLVEKYIHASALLIPLRDTIQDIARFPHKIGEYTASGNPLITVKVGDVEKYFNHKQNALLADKYATEEFTELMNYVITNPVEAKQIGKNGYETGMRVFNYKAYGKKLLQFFEKE